MLQNLKVLLQRYYYLSIVQMNPVFTFTCFPILTSPDGITKEMITVISLILLSEYKDLQALTLAGPTRENLVWDGEFHPYPKPISSATS